MSLRQSFLFAAAWVTFVVSLFLPVVLGDPSPPPPQPGQWFTGPLIFKGYEALQWSFYMLQFWKFREVKNILGFLVAVSNVLMILSPVILLVIKKGLRAWRIIYVLTALIVIGATLAEWVFSGAGYYVWLLSFVLLAVAVNVRAATVRSVEAEQSA